MVKVQSWGRLDASEHDVVPLVNRRDLAKLLSGHRPGISHGMGRSYGDSCLNQGGTLWTTRGLDRFISFDKSQGVLRCEAGVTLKEIQALTTISGWTLPVTPGTQLVTVGGAIANDVHGKNHHFKGSFGDHLRSFQLVRTNGETIACSPSTNSNLFAATIGGLGLTGVISEVEIQLKSVPGPWLETETIPYSNLSEFFELADQSEADWEHTVSWIDCLSGTTGRGVFLRANPIHMNKPTPIERKFTIPFTPPFSLVNKITLAPFNNAYYRFNTFQSGKSIKHYQPFFYPLDNVLHWNRMYGPKGFFQYQMVVPRESGQDATKAMLGEITKSSVGSFLAVLKTFANRKSAGMLSFPMPGVTLALDFPNHGDSTLNLFNRLDSIVRNAGGRLYPAKDARMPRDVFEAGFPRLQEFLAYRDPGISSSMSRRLLGS